MNLYDFSVKNNQGETVSLDSYKGKVVLIVNTASKCGFTPQLADLQTLYETYQEKGFTVLAFPSNQFANQEPESDAQIQDYYHREYGVTFPIMAKSDVNGPNATSLFAWLRKQKGGLFGRKIKWNFTKFLINREGVVVSRHASSLNPLTLQPFIEKQLDQ